MKRNGWLVFLAVLLTAAQMEGRNRGHASAGGLAPFRPGAVMGPGIGSHGIRRHGAFGFGVGRAGLGFRRSWPLFGQVGCTTRNTTRRRSRATLTLLLIRTIRIPQTSTTTRNLPSLV